MAPSTTQPIGKCTMSKGHYFYWGLPNEVKVDNVTQIGISPSMSMFIEVAFAEMTAPAIAVKGEIETLYLRSR